MSCRPLDFFIVFAILAFALFSGGCNTDQLSPNSNVDLSSEVTLDPLFSDNMVLQRGLPIKIRGWAKPRALIAISLGDHKGRAVADSAGEWIAVLPSMTAGGPYELSVNGSSPITLRNIMIGDVWICSGQSNMSFTVNSAQNRDAEKATATNSNIRFFTLNRKISDTPLEKLDLNGGWVVCSPKTVGAFSAVGYFFGREIQKEIGVPIGLINTSWGGTVAEAWTSVPMLRTMADFDARIAVAAEILKSRKMDDERVAKLSKERDKKLLELWKIESDVKVQKQIASLEFDDSSWGVMKVPAMWERAGLSGYDGAVWFRKTIDIPKEWAGKTLELRPGPIDEVDIAYFNGVRVGGMGGVKKYNNEFWNVSRKYAIPADLVKPGKNVIAILIFDLSGAGGIWGDDGTKMKLVVKESPEKAIRIDGEWKYNPMVKIPPNPRHKVGPNNPAFLFNAMINPLLNFPIAGAIWYQGESNAGRAYQYRRLFPAMIQDWRIRWGEGDFPFYFVQLANFMRREAEPGNSAWAELREAQLMALRLPNTGMAVIIDVGDAKDIHPKNKQDVGRRLAYNALNQHYGKKIERCGPIYKTMKIVNGKIELSFSDVGGGLIAKGGKLKGFAIAGADRKFVWAEARIKVDQVVVWNENVRSPVAVRYAWANNPECNLYNKEKLPATPFRTDSWPGVTIDR